MDYYLENIPFRKYLKNKQVGSYNQVGKLQRQKERLPHKFFDNFLFCFS